MKRILLFMGIFLISTSLFAYSDKDMDGVTDSVDQCPNTSFMDLVDINGCTKTVLIPKQNKEHYDILIGVDYSDSNFASLNQLDTYASTLQVDYYYENFSLQAATSYYTTTSNGYSENGMNDSLIGVAYNLKPNNSLTIRLGASCILPTYKTALNNNNADYAASVNLNYTVDEANVFFGYSHTIINDDDIAGTVAYQNTNAYNIGLGYYLLSNFYMSGAYNKSDSIYSGVEDVETASVYGYYSIDKNWFTTLYYAYGLSSSASDNAISIKLGYYF
jgi:hypothetical protein